MRGAPTFKLSGIAHLGQIIDKIRLRHVGQIHNYNDSTVGFDRYLSTSSNSEGVPEIWTVWEVGALRNPTPEGANQGARRGSERDAIMGQPSRHR
ncbi:MAG: DUF5069 domain-containing protein, partial [Nitrospiraceae bacterium]|nr:DUF5069 domain-containing protein [Nitrospiraceae bacterium]